MLYVNSCGTFRRSLFMVLIGLQLFGSTLSIASPNVSPSEQNVAPRVKSYLEWKNSKVHAVEVKIKSIKEKLTSTGNDPNLKLVQKQNSITVESGLSVELQSQLDEELLNLANTQDLTMSDYFVGYVTKHSSTDKAIEEIATRLSPEEVAQIMRAYAEQIIEKPSSSVKSQLNETSGL